MEKMKISAGTIVRTLVLALALLNQVLAATGHTILDIEEGSITQFVNLGITIAAAVWAWWKNNSFTQDALIADESLKAMRASDK